MKVSFVTCDVFTDRPFTGNPLLVVPDARGLTAEKMQAVAREINYSESTFVLPPKNASHAYLQRTFVPVKEIPYAGHPTVGTAVVMAALGKVASVAPGPPDGIVPITIEVGFGPLGLELLKADGRVSRVRMEQGKPEWKEPVVGDDVKGQIAAALGVPFDALHPELPPQAVGTGNTFLIVPLASVSAVSSAESRRILASSGSSSSRLIPRLTAPASAPGCSRRARACPRTPRRARRRGPSASTSRSTARCRAVSRKGAGAS
jgi:trans-2,3-dihydro-3-hydroxyanthranilate isomerase